MKGAPASSEGEGGRPLAPQEVGAGSGRSVDSISRRPCVRCACAVSRRRTEDGDGGVCEEALLRGREGDGGRRRGERGAAWGPGNEGRRDPEAAGALTGELGRCEERGAVTFETSVSSPA